MDNREDEEWHYTEVDGVRDDAEDGRESVKVEDATHADTTEAYRNVEAFEG